MTDIHGRSTFAVSREHIHQHPKHWYEKLLAAVSNHSNPEDGHFLERSWVAVFHPIPVRLPAETRVVLERPVGTKSIVRVCIASQEDCLISAKPLPPSKKRVMPDTTG